jgi:transcriptional regulator with XRE-family HTH domain
MDFAWADVGSAMNVHCIIAEPRQIWNKTRMAQKTKASTQEHYVMRIREELARRRMARASLADAAKISLSSLEKSLAGQRPFTDQTLVRIEKALGLSFQRSEAQRETDQVKVAPDGLGSYARASVKWLEGSFLTLRPATATPNAIYAYETLIFWDFETEHLQFREMGRTDKIYAQSGSVAVPHQSGQIYLTTNKHGQHRTAILSRHVITGELYGLLLTLQPGLGAHLSPVAMPLVLIPMENLEEDTPRGVVDADHPMHAELRVRLDKTLGEGFALMLGR